MSGIVVSLHSSDTREEWFETLARVFGEQSGGTSRWVTLEASGVTVNIFGSPIAEQDPDEPKSVPEPQSLRA